MQATIQQVLFTSTVAGRRDLQLQPKACCKSNLRYNIHAFKTINDAMMSVDTGKHTNMYTETK
jgi:hypothetical protein